MNYIILPARRYYTARVLLLCLFRSWNNELCVHYVIHQSFLAFPNSLGSRPVGRVRVSQETPRYGVTPSARVSPVRCNKKKEKKIHNKESALLYRVPVYLFLFRLIGRATTRRAPVYTASVRIADNKPGRQDWKNYADRWRDDVSATEILGALFRPKAQA